MNPDLEPEVRRRQQARTRVMAVLLGLFALLLFAVTIAKMSVNQ